MKTTQEKLKLIREAFSRLQPIDNISFTPYREKLFAMCRDEERAHRTPGFTEAHTADTASVYDMGLMFTVRQIAVFLNGDRMMPTAKDYLHVRHSYFYAAALVANYRKEIRKAWKGLPVAELAALDYCEFVKVREVKS